MLKILDFFKTATNFIIAITFIIFILQQFEPRITILLGLNPLFINYSFYFQPLTTIFVHGSLLHILTNMAMFYHYGNIVELITSKKFLLSLYLVGGILTSLLSYIYIMNNINPINMIGASGALSVIFGFIAQKSKNERMGLIMIVLLSSFLPEIIFNISVAWYAHFIGFAIGYLIAIKIKIRFKID